ncbi:sensor histidine kinase efflux regulator BaeS [Amantichitinum ursilacus]|uniref:Signal transduction histidine-protein kinase/phosphatase MprB n=1 Tax=Amantichitinum ursilacus TaxID=857265 RepID=A0A0N1JTF6_9NEIS|nr:sensor histidine kinase efflux regulator BaeS [Amantichitinum ursilacus]KPC54408.1 Signal transduction histidine-protein kinase BaeS [Amantichitinum ursilacus]
MKLGITAKLFIAILASCAVVLLVNGVAARISFQRGFLGYLNEQGVERMQEVMPHIQAAYRQHGSWQFLHGDMEAWFHLMRPDPDPGRALTGPPVSDQTGAVPRFGLLDTQYQQVVGNPTVGRESILRPVVVEGRTVGWLAMVPFQKAIAAGDVRFYEAQMQMWWLIGVFSVLFAAALAYLLARTLLLRLHGLTGATHRLASGNYGSRVPENSRDELGALARDFNQLAQTLEHTERARRNFMADISHELRTPLAVMRAEVEAIQDGIRPLSQAALEPIAQQIGQLGKLVNDLHDLSLTDVGALTYRRASLDLALLLQALLGSMQARFAAAGLQLNWTLDNAPIRVDGDERRLQQLFANLLENAVRYTDAGGEVRVTCERTAGQIKVRFDDSPPGVDPDKLPRLFERFYRTEGSRNRNSGGSGLGLAICRNIAEAHDGQIEAAASPLGGVRIVVTLPEAL